MLCRSLGLLPRTVTSLSRLCYCSQNANGASSRDADDATLRAQLLNEALTFVPKHGWSRQALQLAAEKQGLPGVAHGMFPRGGIELVEHFYSSCNERLAETMTAEHEAVQQEKQAKRKTNEFIYDHVQKRLSMLAPHRANWHQAMAQMALPQNAPRALQNLHHLVDDIWYYAGDRSTDMNYYIKRLALAGLYQSTELYLLQDTSSDQQDTWAFLHRRMDNLNTAGKCVKQAQQGSGMLGDLTYSAFVTIQNMLGMNSRNR